MNGTLIFFNLLISGVCFCEQKIPKPLNMVSTKFSYIILFCTVIGSNLKGDFICASLPAGLGGNGEFERKFEDI